MIESPSMIAANRTGTVACAPMRDPQALEATLQALLVSRQRDALAIGSVYDDVAIEIAAYRMERTDAAAMNLAKAGEGLVCRLDDMSDSSDPKWQAASLAIDPFIV